MRLVSLAEDRCVDESQSHIDRQMWLLVRIILERRSPYNIRSKSHSTMARTKNPAGSAGAHGVRCKKSGDTYSRTFGTTIGSESLTTVFGMGTGVAFQIWSPERDRLRAVR